MVARRIDTRVNPDGTVTLAGQALPPGTEVEVIVLVRDLERTEPYPLRGTPYRFDDPFEPAAAEEWEAAR